VGIGVGVEWWGGMVDVIGGGGDGVARFTISRSILSGTHSLRLSFRDLRQVRSPPHNQHHTSTTPPT
jgi:hypothetical protein